MLIARKLKLKDHELFLFDEALSFVLASCESDKLSFWYEATTFSALPIIALILGT